MIYDFNETAVPFPEAGLIQEVFEEQVERVPDSVAVICGDQQITYAQLNRRANQVARNSSMRCAHRRLESAFSPSAVLSQSLGCWRF